MPQNFLLCRNSLLCQSHDNWGLLGGPQDRSLNPIMPEGQCGAAKWFNVDFPQGEEHRKIMPHINMGQAK